MGITISDDAVAKARTAMREKRRDDAVAKLAKLYEAGKDALEAGNGKAVDACIKFLDGDLKGGLEELGLKTDESSDTEAGPKAPRMLVADANADAKKAEGYGPDVTILKDGTVYLPEVDLNGNKTNGADQQLDEVVKNKFAIVKKPDGLIYGFNRGSIAAPADTQDLDTLVPIYLDDEETPQRISIKDGRADKDKYQELKVGGKTIGFKVKVSKRWNRKSH